MFFFSSRREVELEGRGEGVTPPPPPKPKLIGGILVMWELKNAAMDFASVNFMINSAMDLGRVEAQTGSSR